jgi:hypothetical protein
VENTNGKLLPVVGRHLEIRPEAVDLNSATTKQSSFRRKTASLTHKLQKENNFQLPVTIFKFYRKRSLTGRRPPNS